MATTIWLIKFGRFVTGLHSVVQGVNVKFSILQSLDTGEEFPSFSDHSSSDVALAFGTTLLELLDALTEPVIPYAVQERCAQATSRDEAFEVSAHQGPVIQVYRSLSLDPRGPSNGLCQRSSLLIML